MALFHSAALELWGAEYQENNALLVRAGLAGDKEGEKDESGMSLLQRIAARENCPFAAVGTITGTVNILSIIARFLTDLFIEAIALFICLHTF